MGKTIMNLTKEQEKLIPVFRDKWRDKFFCLEMDEHRVENFINFLFSLIGEKPPIVLFFDSPFACQLAINFLKMKKTSQLDSQLRYQLDFQLDSQLRYQLDSQLDSQLRYQLDSQLDSQLRSQLRYQLHSQLRSQLRYQLDFQLGSQLSFQLYSQLDSQLRSQLCSQLDFQLFSQLCSQLCSQLYSQLDSQLGSQLSSQLRSQLHSQKIECYSIECYSDISWLGYYCFYDYVNHVLLPKIKIPIFETFLEKFEPITTVVAFNGLVFISRPPVFINFDEQDRLHCTHDAAVSFRDGWKLHYVHGVFFEKIVFEKFFKGDWQGKDFFALKNSEQKAVVIEQFGYEKCLEGVDKIVIDSQNKAFNRNPDRMVNYELFEFDIGTKHRAVKVEWFENGKKRATILGVPNTMKNAVEAIAWTFGKSQKEYEENIVMEA